MSAELLRQAAALMRERAEAARSGRWFRTEVDPGGNVVVAADWAHGPRPVAVCNGSLPEGNQVNAEHIASWHPVVALAVADTLDALAEVLDEGDYTVESDVLPTWLHCHLDNIAATYLGGDA